MNDIKNALNALINRRVEVNIKGVEGLYMRPIPQEVNFDLMAQVDGETEKDREDHYESLTMSYSLVDKEDNPIYTPEEYAVWNKKADSAILVTLIESVRKLNDFMGLDEEAKKK